MTLRDEVIKETTSFPKDLVTSFMVFHNAYQYFEKSYKLNVVGSIINNPSIKPSAKKLQQIKQQISQNQISCLFVEPEFNYDFIKDIIGNKTQILTIDPLGAKIKADENLYFTMMNDIADNITRCINRKTGS